MVKKLKNLVRANQLDRPLLEHLFKKADDICANPKKYARALEGKTTATVFYEESTRTRWSFERATHIMGGNVISTENARQFSSVAKGESLADMVRVTQGYCEVMVLRHHQEGSSELAAQLIDIPVVNAGDGKGEHPSQALLDMYTIKKELGRIDDLRIALVGDLAYGRTVRSLAFLSPNFRKIHLDFVSAPEFRIGNEVKAYLVKNKVSFSERDDLNKAIPEADVIYMTRTQWERIPAAEQERKKTAYIIDEKNLHLIREDARLLHPLPHQEEISLPIEIENDPRVKYLKQASHYGVYARAALLHHLLVE